MKEQPWEWAARQQRAAQQQRIDDLLGNSQTTRTPRDSVKHSNKTIFDCPCGTRVTIRERDVFLCPKCDRLWVLKADEPGRLGYKEAVNVGAK